MFNLAIIAAGNGSRLKAEGIKESKPLIKINNIPLIKRVIDLGIKYGAHSINCIINEESDDLKKYLEDTDYSVPLNLIVKTTKSSLHSLHELSKENSFPLLLATCDSVFLEKEFEAFLEYSKLKIEAEGVIAVTDFIDDEKPLYTATDDDMKITNFNDDDKGDKYITGGLYYFKKNIKKEVDEAVNRGMYLLRNFQRYLIEKKIQLYAFPFSKIIDVDHINDIRKAEELLNNN